jgi:drug/metabolite transporter (DMT)-like permease
MLTRRQAAALVLLTLLWGVNWPIMKFSLREITPLWFRAVTITGGVLVLAAFLRGRGTALTVAPAERGALLRLALPNVVGWHLFSIVGLQALASGRAAILGFTMPVWTVLLTVLVAGERLTRRSVFASACALAAVALLAAQELAAFGGRPLGVLWMQCAALSWAGGTLMMRRNSLSAPTEVVTLWMMAVGVVCFWIAALVAEPVPDFGRMSAGMWWSLAYGVFVNFGVSQLLWFGLARRLPPTASAFSIMAVPLVGLAAATVFVGEVPRLTDLLAAACIVLAIASTVLRR